MDGAVFFVNTYPLDSDASIGQRYPPFEKLGPVLFQNRSIFLIALYDFGDVGLRSKIACLHM